MNAQIVDLRNGEKIFLESSTFTFGRSKTNNIICKKPYVSRSHCRIILKDGKYFIEDLKSKNGTYINGRKINSIQELNNNDTIALYVEGPIYQFRLTEEAIIHKTSALGRIFFEKRFLF